MHCASCCKQAEIALVLALEFRQLSSSVRRREAATSRLIRLGTILKGISLESIPARSKHSPCRCCIPRSSVPVMLADRTVASSQQSVVVEADHVGHNKSRRRARMTLLILFIMRFSQHAWVYEARSAGHDHLYTPGLKGAAESNIGAFQQDFSPELSQTALTKAIDKLTLTVCEQVVCVS